MLGGLHRSVPSQTLAMRVIDYSQVDTLGMRFTSVDVWGEKEPGLTKLVRPNTSHTLAMEVTHLVWSTCS